MSQYCFVHQKSYIENSGIDPGPPPWKACD